MKRILLLAISTLLILTGCAQPDRGRVADGRYSPAHSTWHSGSTSCSGTPTVCTTSSGWMQHTPQSWELRLIDGEQDGWRDVDESTFHRCNIDEHFPECAQDDR